MTVSDFQQARILVVGDVMLDKYWHGSVDRISPESPVPVVDVGEESATLGGAANVAANVVGLGAQCALLSIVGDDDAGRRILELAQLAKIEPLLSVDAKVRTTEKLRIVARNQQLIRVDFESNPTHEVLAESLGAFREALNHAQVVILSDYGKGGLAHIREMIAAAKERGIPVVVDPKGVDYQRYRGASVITPNLKEFQQAGGDTSSEESMQNSAQNLIAEHELKGLLLTRSEQGMTLFLDSGEMLNSPAISREVYDVSGAGDTVAAVIGTGLAAGIGYEELLQLANRAAGCVVSKFGTAAITLEELQES